MAPFHLSIKKHLILEHGKVLISPRKNQLLKFFITLKFYLVILATVIFSGVVISQDQRKKTEQSRTLNTHLQTAYKKIERLKSENAKLSALYVDRKELEQLRSQTEELLKLRNSVSKLRDTDRTDPKQLQVEIEKLELQAQKDRDRSDLIKEWEEAKKTSREMKRTLQSIGHLIPRVTGLNNGIPPQSFEEIQIALKADQEDYWVDVIEKFIEQGKLTNLELIPAQFKSSFNNERLVPIMREIIPRQFPDGRWARFYTYENGNSEEIILPENNFDEWELENFQ